MKLGVVPVDEFSVVPDFLCLLNRHDCAPVKSSTRKIRIRQGSGGVNKCAANALERENQIGAAGALLVVAAAPCGARRCGRGRRSRLRRGGRRGARSFRQRNESVSCLAQDAIRTVLDDSEKQKGNGGCGDGELRSAGGLGLRVPAEEVWGKGERKERPARGRNRFN